MIAYLKRLLHRSARLFLTLMKVMLPILIAVKIADELGAVAVMTDVLTPVMTSIGLPAESALIWATCLLTGLYGAIAVIIGLAGQLEMTTAQLSALCAMMLFAHAIPIEQAIVRRAGASFWLTAALRVGVGLVYGAGVALFCKTTGLLADPVDFTWLAASGDGQVDEGLLAWVLTTATGIAATLAIIVGLLVLLDALAAVGITDRITRLLMPVLRVSGLSRDVAPVTTTGVLLGLTYGGALIIAEAEEKNFPPRTRLLALSWLSLSHSLIEDTALLFALGADLWVILVGRLIVTLLVVAMMARLTTPPDPLAQPA